MNHKKILAVIAALCLTVGAFPWDSNAGMPNTPGNVYAEENNASNSITIECVGDKAPIILSGTTEKPTWYSDDESVATIAPTGDLSAEITATGKGSTSVYAVLSGQLLRFDVTVLKANADEQTIVNVGSLSLTAAQTSASAKLNNLDNSLAVWSSSDTSVAVVDSNGKITAVGKGECVITAVYKNTTYLINVVSSYDLQDVTQPEEKKIGDMTLTDDAPAQKISFELPDGTTVKFSSTDEAVASVSADGTVTAKGTGKCRIYAEIGNVRNYIEVTSTYTGKMQSSFELDETTLTAASPSKKVTLNNIPDGKEVKWRTTDPSVAVVNSNGVIVAEGKGECQIIAEVDGIEYIMKVTVDINDMSELPVTEIRGIGKTVTIQGMGGDTKYTTTDPDVASVDENGVITSQGTGYAVIIAESPSSVSYLRVKVIKAGVLGDANSDGRVTVADATAVLQHIGNRDKYGLSDEEIANADVDGEKGLSGNDALTIQLFEIGLISSLPLVPES